MQVWRITQDANSSTWPMQPDTAETNNPLFPLLLFAMYEPSSFSFRRDAIYLRSLVGHICTHIIPSMFS